MGSYQLVQLSYPDLSIFAFSRCIKGIFKFYWIEVMVNRRIVSTVPA